MPIAKVDQVNQQVVFRAPESVPGGSGIKGMVAAERKIVAEAGCWHVTAWVTLIWIGRMVASARAASGTSEHRMNRWMQYLPQYDVFDTVMPHGKVAKPGSAHEAIERAHLKPLHGEYALRHESDQYCTFRLLANRIY